MARELVAYCDVCKKPDAVEYSISKTKDGHWLIDLCEEHGAELEALAEKGRPVEHPRPGRVGQSRYDQYVRGVPDLPAEG